MSFDPTAGVPGALIARGARADVHEWLDTAGVETPSVVVKVYRGDGGRRSALALAVALAAVDHPHLLPLRGLVAVGSTGIGVLLPRLSTRSASEWLRGRRVVSAGEAVTLLAPILLALLHVDRRRLDARVTLDADLHLDDVLFDARGAPVLTGVRVVATGRRGADPTAVARRLVHDVVTSTVGGSASARARLLALCAREGTIDELLEVAFELDEPAALEEAPLGAVVPAGRDSSAGDDSAGDDSAGDEPRVGGDRGESVRAAASRIASGLRQVRPRVWATTAVLGVSAVLALTLLGGPSTPSTTPSARSAASAPTPSKPSVSRAADDSGRAPEADRGQSRDDVTSELLRSDDADGATRELLRLRTSCLAALDRECLAGVEQAGSSVLANDTAAVDDPATLEARHVELRISAVVNRLGGAVLYRALTPDDEPASVLVTRTEAGWRLRSIT